MTAARRRALLGGLALASAAVPLLAAPQAGAQVLVPSPERQVYVFVVPGVSFEELLSSPDVRAIARAGGAGLMSAQLGAENPAYAPGFGTPMNVSVYRLPAPPSGLGREQAIRRIGDRIREVVPSTPGLEVLVIVASPSSSDAMIAAKDDLHPIVVAHDAADRLFHVWRPPGALTSDSTRRIGVVSDADIAPTVRRFLGQAMPAGDEGMPIRVVDEAAPFLLHERYLAMRRMTVPIQTAVGLYVTLAGLFGVALLALRHRVGRRLTRVAGLTALSVPALGVALLAAGHLPSLSYATVVPFTIGVTLLGTLAFAPLAKRDVLLAPAAIGWAVLAYFVVEASLGWTAALTPFLGGSELDGGRFYGLPNVFIGLLVGASLYAAHRLPGPWGFALIVAVALFAGLPFAGANLGGAVTLFAAAGLWLAIRSRGRLDPRGVAIAAGVVLVGTTLVLLSHRYLASTPTHVTRFEETSGRSLSGIWRTFTDRFLVGWRLILLNPFALVPVLGVPATLLAVLRPPAPVRAALETNAAWRDGLLVILLAGVVAVLPNDSWPAALGLSFGLGLGGLLYVSLLAGTGKMGAA